MANRVFLSNDSAGYTTEERYVTVGVKGNFTSSSTGNIAFAVPAGIAAGSISGFTLGVGTNGVDGANALQVAGDLKKNGTSVLSTTAVIAKAAGTGAKNTLAAGTGITLPVLKTDGTANVVSGDLLTVDFTLTRTASPSTEIADVWAVITIRTTAVA